MEQKIYCLVIMQHLLVIAAIVVVAAPVVICGPTGGDKTPVVLSKFNQSS